MRRKAALKTISCLILLAATAAAQARSFSVTGSTAGAGGGTSSSVDFTVSGTVGEPLTSAMSGGAFTVATGFWGVVGTVATPDAPTLVIESQPDGSIVVSWPVTATGFTLEQSHDLTSGGWAAAPYPTSDDGTRKSVQVWVPAGVQFFRLRKWRVKGC